MKVKELIEMLNQYDEDYEIYGDSFVDDSEYILEIYDIEDGIDKVYIMMQDMI